MTQLHIHETNGELIQLSLPVFYFKLSPVGTSPCPITIGPIEFVSPIIALCPETILDPMQHIPPTDPAYCTFTPCAIL